MGRLGLILGVRIKGQLWLELERVAYHAGDVVQGAICLPVNEEFHCDGGLVLEINGSETIAWIQRVGKRGHLPRHKRSTILQQQQQVPCGHDTFSPGEYVYPFAYKLHSKLPGSFQFFNGGTGNMWDICVQIKYQLKARLPIQGTFTSNLEGKQGIVVIPSPTVREIYPLGRSKNKEVRMLAIASKGSCQLSVSMGRNVYAPGEELTMFCSIANHSKMNIRALSIRLYEDIVLHKWVCDTNISTCLCYLRPRQENRWTEW